MGLSKLGIFHTAIGVIAIIAAVIAFTRNGKIDLNKITGKIYFYFTLVTSFTALGLSSIQGFNPGHLLALLVIILVAAAYFLNTKRPGNTRLRYVETFFLSFSFFLSMIPTVNETFTRIPIGHPLAHGPKDPFIVKTLMFLLFLFIVGLALQIRQQWRMNKFNPFKEQATKQG